MNAFQRSLLFLAFVGIIPACGGTTSSPTDTSLTETYLFEDDFNRSSLGSDYTADAGSPVTMDATVGNPPGSVQFPPATTGGFSTVATYGNASTTFSIDFSVDTSAGTATLSIADIHTSWVITGTMTNGGWSFYMNSTTATGSFPWVAGQFHTISFRVGGGTMDWLFDGVVTLHSQVAWPPTQLRLSFDGMAAHADNFEVETP